MTAHQLPESADMISAAIAEAKKQKLVKVGHKIVTIQAVNEDTTDESNIMKIINID